MHTVEANLIYLVGFLKSSSMVADQPESQHVLISMMVLGII